MAVFHVVGAGLAGLSCAVELAAAGRRVVVHESAGQAGGRCRSYFDERLGATIDNGNHLLLSGNAAAVSYLRTIGAEDTLSGPPEAAFPFVDLRSGEQWTVRPGRGVLPWWLLSGSRRVAGTRLYDYGAGLRLMMARRGATLHRALPRKGALYERFWEPLAVAVLNCPPEEAAAALLKPVLLRTFARGAEHCRPLVARNGLSASFVEPALACLAAHGAQVSLGHGLRSIERSGGAAVALEFADSRVPMSRRDRLVLAVPPANAARLLPGLVVPEGSRAIVNAHVRLATPLFPPWPAPFAGVIGGTVHWLFLRGDIVSATVSGADALADKPAEEIETAVWSDMARILSLPRDPMPPIRIVKERRATFAQTPEQVVRRPPTRTRWDNVLLAGDWTATGLPATIESAVLSGKRAAIAAMAG